MFGARPPANSASHPAFTAAIVAAGTYVTNPPLPSEAKNAAVAGEHFEAVTNCAELPPLKTASPTPDGGNDPLIDPALAGAEAAAGGGDGAAVGMAAAAGAGVAVGVATAVGFAPAVALK